MLFYFKKSLRLKKSYYLILDQYFNKNKPSNTIQQIIHLFT